MDLPTGTIPGTGASGPTEKPWPAVDADVLTAVLPPYPDPQGAVSDEPSAGPWTEELLGERYRIAELIGRGGSAAVYRGIDIRLRRPVAVKIFHPLVTDSRTMRRRQAEVDFLVRLSHPGLVALLDAHIAANPECPREPSYLVMELVEGTSLDQLLCGGVLTASTTADIGRQLASALAVVHRSAMIHRDIKPGNILLGNLGIAKLADFGIARLIDSARLTTTAEVMGTPLYLSPEQARGMRSGTATDIYSLGLVLLECLTGSPAFPGSAVESAMARLASNPAMPEFLEPGWVTLLRKMTDPDPDRRPAASAVAATLATLLPTTLRAPRPPSSAQHTRIHHRDSTPRDPANRQPDDVSGPWPAPQAC